MVARMKKRTRRREFVRASKVEIVCHGYKKIFNPYKMSSYSVIRFSNRGNPTRRHFSMEPILEPISEFHAHMLGAVFATPSMVTHMHLPSSGISENVMNQIQPMKAEGSLGDCSICQEDIKEGDQFKRLPCSDTVNHCFHTQCIDPWLKQQKTCPNCRSNLEGQR